MSYRCHHAWQVFAVAILAAHCAAAELRAEPAFTCTFNGPENVWKVLDNGVPSEVMAHDCLPGGARDQGGIEHVTVAATAGQSVLLECPTPPVAALDELQVRLWVKSARPDVQLAARISLPRSRDPKNHTMATAIVKGTAYKRPGHWQELVISEVPKLLAAQVRIMRATPGAAIDAHEAYLESVVLFVPGDPKGFEVETDQLEVEGVIVTPPSEIKPTTTKVDTKIGKGRGPAPRSAAQVLQAGFNDDGTPTGDRSSPVRLQGSTLIVEGRPFLPRVIEWNGEPLKFLAERGFNAIKLQTSPNPQQTADAQRYGLWFVCTPPRPETLAQGGLGAVGDRVLAWYLDDDALEADPNYAQRWAELVRENDVVYGRPILIVPDANWGAASKFADILIARNSRISVTTGPEYEAWLESRRQLAQPGMPLWVTLNTQFGEAVHVQANALAHATGPSPAVDSEQLESLLQIAGTCGARGYMFQSSSPLSESDPATRTRVTAVELLNRRLQLMEPWLAGGKVVSYVTSTNNAVTAAVMHVDRARLLILQAEDAEKSALLTGNRPAAKELTFVVPGVSESSQTYFVTPISMRSLTSERIAGGTRISTPTGNDGFIVITEDPKVVQSLRQHIARHGSQIVRLERDLAVSRAQAVFQTDQRLTQLGLSSKLSANDAATVNARLAQLDALMTSGQLEQAQALVAAANADSRRMVAEQRQIAIVASGLSSNALGLSYDRLIDFVALERSLDNLRVGENLLAGGDLENLGEMTQFGWQHVVHASAGAATHAELSADGPQHGTYCLELQAVAPANKQSAAAYDPLVWIVSPGVPVDAGKLVEITGWVRIEKPFGPTGGGLAIVDTLGGPELSLVVHEASSWQSFRMIRAVPKSTELRLTFALMGLGAAKIDAVMVRTLQQPIARRLPEIAGAGSANPPSTNSR